MKRKFSQLIVLLSFSACAVFFFAYAQSTKAADEPNCGPGITNTDRSQIDVTTESHTENVPQGQNFTVSINNSKNSFPVGFDIVLLKNGTTSVYSKTGSLGYGTSNNDYDSISIVTTKFDPSKYTVRTTLHYLSPRCILKTQDNSITLTASASTTASGTNSNTSTSTTSPSPESSTGNTNSEFTSPPALSTPSEPNGELKANQPTTVSTNGEVNPSLGDIFSRIWGNDPASANLSSVNKLIKEVLDYAFNFAGIVAFIMVLWAARMFFNSYGSDETAAMAKKTLTWALVGLCVIIVSKAILVWIYGFLLN